MKLVNHIKQQVMGSEFLKSVSVLFSGNLIANIISFASIPILSRLYSKTAFGDYAIIVSVAHILVTATAFGLTSAIMMPREDHDSRKLFTTAYCFQFIVISIVFSFFVLGFVLKGWQVYSFSGNYLLSLVLAFFYTAVYALFSMLLVFVNRLKKNRVLFWNALINASSLLVITIPLGLLGTESYGFVIGATLSYLIADGQMILKTSPFVRVHLFDSLKETLSKYKRFILYQFPSNVLGTFTIQIPNQFFSRFFGNNNLGGYAMCERVLGVPMRLIGAPINTVYFRQSSQYVREGKDLSSFTFKLVTRVLIVAFVPVVLLICLAKPIFTFILGDEWTSVGEIVSVMVFPYLISFCCSCVSYCLVVLDRQIANLFLTSSQLLIVSGFILAGYYYSHNFYTTLVFYSIGISLYHLLHIVVIFYYLKKHFSKFLFFITVYSSLVFAILFTFGK